MRPFAEGVRVGRLVGACGEPGDPGLVVSGVRVEARHGAPRLI
jgi:hypothetical protein